jgi:type IV secretion system protein VirB9
VTHFHPAGALLLVAATVTPQAASADPRFTARAYVANEIVTLHSSPGIESAIAFAPDERIENIAVGNSTNWDVNPNKRANVVFVKPARARVRTNMTIITSQRTYLFDLVSSSPAASVYMMRFTYPDAPKAVPAAVPGVVKLADADRPAVQKPAPLELNFAWRSAGEKRLLPVSYFDDGASTFLHWDKDANLPAILIRGPDGAEGPVNFTVKGDYIVVEGVPAQLVLRSGKQVATLTPTRRAVAAPTQTAEAGAPRPLGDIARSER